MAPRTTLYGWRRHVWQIRVPALALQGTAAAILSSWTPGYACEIEKIEYVITVAHTSAGAGTRAFTLRKGGSAGTPVAVITPTHATAVTAGGVGVILAQTSLAQAESRFAAGDVVTIDYATGTAFTAGEADLYITVREKRQTLA